MGVESLFTVEGGEASGKGVSMTVWQAEVALRLSKSPKKYPTSFKALITKFIGRLFAKGVWNSYSTTDLDCVNSRGVYCSPSCERICANQVQQL